jgi:ATP-binding cassette subfamily B protein
MKRHKVRRGTFRRVIPYAKRRRWPLAGLLLLTAVHAGIAVSTPIILKFIIDDGILKGSLDVVIALSVLIAALGLLDAGAVYLQSTLSGVVGQGILYDLRTTVFAHVQRQPLAFFTHTQTGALISRLNTDVVGAQQAVTTLLSQATSTVLTLLLVFGALLVLSWKITLLALALIPVFMLPGRLIGRRLQRLTRHRMQLDAELASMMSERFNVAGAALVKLHGQPEREYGAFSAKAASVRDVSTKVVVHGQLLFIIFTVLAAMINAVVYGFGGQLVIQETIEVGTLVAMATLLLRVYGPLNQLSNLQANVMTALVSFDRLFEVLDLKPIVQERAEAKTLRAGPPRNLDIEFDRVSFRYPKKTEVSLASLQAMTPSAPERHSDAWVLRDMSFRAPAGKLTALVGPSGAGKTTITHLVPRLYDVAEGVVRIGGEDVRDLTLRSIAETVGVVTQDAHMFHDTLRANLLYTRPDAQERDLIEACKAAQVWDVIAALPAGLDTVVGDRGYRLSGGEKQRVALARLLLKSPPIVVLDEATAHLDSESEAAIQQALVTALSGRTSLIIAHRLSTVRHADQILVVDGGRIVERGTHDELLAGGGLYSDLYRIQYARQADEPVRVRPTAP